MVVQLFGRAAQPSLSAYEHVVQQQVAQAVTKQLSREPVVVANSV